MEHSVSRRHFFLGSLAAAVPLAGFGSAPSLKAMGYKSPNEKLNVASIGAGGRAASDIQGCASENIVALADVDSNNAGNMFKRYESVPKYNDFRKMLDKEAKNIDAVIVAIPDHMHAYAAVSCMQLGKHVYVEKPLTRTIWEARLLTDAAAKYKVATQMGNQGYSNDGTRIAAELIWSGEIGAVKEVHAWTNRPVWPQGVDQLPAEEPVPDTLNWDVWLGTAAMRPYSKTYAPFNWRGWFDFGCGALGDMACHILGAPNMALLLGAPTSVEVVRQEGKNPYTFPRKSVTRFEFPARKNMPPLTLYWYDAMTGPAHRPPGISEDEPLIGGPGSFGAAGTQFSGGGAVTPAPAAPPAPATKGQGQRARRAGGGGGSQNNGAVFIGDKGILTTDTYANNVRLLPEARHKETKLPPQLLTRSPGHHRDWIRACKGGDPSCSNFSIAGPLTEWIVLGSIALHFEGKLEWDAAKMKITNNAEANKLVKPYMRKGWTLSL
ncbi:MAG: Gfo/Idh/MocA family oxidoreductase [Acidobacteria bacterium]|nr:Gfo/Idh/MocA family oxidoreductase [Acidobacteriota bacterium]